MRFSNITLALVYNLHAAYAYTALHLAITRLVYVKYAASDLVIDRQSIWYKTMCVLRALHKSYIQLLYYNTGNWRALNVLAVVHMDQIGGASKLCYSCNGLFSV